MVVKKVEIVIAMRMVGMGMGMGMGMAGWDGGMVSAAKMNQHNLLTVCEDAE